MARLLKISKYIYFASVALILLAFLFWSFLSSAYYTGFLFFGTGLLFMPFSILSGRYYYRRMVILLTLFILIASGYAVVVAEMNDNIKTLSQKLYTYKTQQHFSLLDKLNIYGLNIMMGVAALPLYPQAARETLWMIIPADKGMRKLESNFPLGSDNINKILVPFTSSLNSTSKKVVQLKEQTIVWKPSDYALGEPEAKYALALNAADVSAIATKQDTGWRIHVTTKVKIRYPERSRVTLIHKPELQIEEGLFWILQEAGWLHSYVAYWESTITYDNKQ